MTDAPTSGSEHFRRLRELAVLFLKLGLIGFGGPAAHIAMMEDEVVRRRAWISREAFLDLLGATNLIPGPNSTELAIHIGRERASAAFPPRSRQPPGFFSRHSSSSHSVLPISRSFAPHAWPAHFSTA